MATSGLPVMTNSVKKVYEEMCAFGAQEYEIGNTYYVILEPPLPAPMFCLYKGVDTVQWRMIISAYDIDDEVYEDAIKLTEWASESSLILGWKAIKPLLDAFVKSHIDNK